MNTRSITLPAPAPIRGRRWRVPLGLLLPTFALLAAEIGVRVGLIPPNQLPAPSQVAQTLLYLAQHGLAEHVASSTLRVLAGFAAGALLAVLLGAALIVAAKLLALPELDTPGLMIVTAGGGYILRELGPATPGK